MVGSLIGPTFFRGGSRTKFQHQLWSDDPLPKVLSYICGPSYAGAHLHSTSQCWPLDGIGNRLNWSTFLLTFRFWMRVQMRKLLRGETIYTKFKYPLSLLYAIVLVLTTMSTIELKNIVYAVDHIDQSHYDTCLIFWCPYFATSVAIYISLKYRCRIKRIEAHIRYNDMVGWVCVSKGPRCGLARPSNLRPEHLMPQFSSLPNHLASRTMKLESIKFSFGPPMPLCKKIAWWFSFTNGFPFWLVLVGQGDLFTHIWGEGISIVSKNIPHPSDIENLTSYRFVANSSQMIWTRLECEVNFKDF